MLRTCDSSETSVPLDGVEATIRKFHSHLSVRRDDSRHHIHYRIIGSDGGLKLPTSSSASSAVGRKSSTRSKDVRKLMDASSQMPGGKELNIPMPDLLCKRLLRKLDASEIGELMTEFNLLAE